MDREQFGWLILWVYVIAVCQICQCVREFVEVLSD